MRKRDVTSWLCSGARPHFSTSAKKDRALDVPANRVRAPTHLARALGDKRREGPRTRGRPAQNPPALLARTHKCAQEVRAGTRFSPMVLPPDRHQYPAQSSEQAKRGNSWSSHVGLRPSLADGTARTGAVSCAPLPLPQQPGSRAKAPVKLGRSCSHACLARLLRQGAAPLGRPLARRPAWTSFSPEPTPSS